MKSGKKYWSDWTPVAGQQFEYSLDDIGNRVETRSGGDENGWNLRAASGAWTTTSMMFGVRRTMRSMRARNIRSSSARNVPAASALAGVRWASSRDTTG